MPSPRRLNEADTNFLLMGLATGTPFVPLNVSVNERAHADPATVEHLSVVMSRLVPAMHQRIARDRLSTALPRWEDVPGFHPEDQIVRLPAPGDGTLRAVLDWAQEWGRTPLPLDRPPWRAAHFEGVEVDGVPDRYVTVSQFHHALIDGMGAMQLARHFYQWGPGDESLPELPPPVEPDTSTRWERWRSGWALEGAKARELAANTGRRLRWAASDPAAGAARARELAQAVRRLQGAIGTEPLSPLLRRRTDRNRFDVLRVDLDRLRAGSRARGGSLNDGLMAGVSLGLQRWHLDHGIRAPELRTAMAISTRADDEHGGNAVIAAMIRLPLLEDPEAALKECQAISRVHRDDRDLLWLMDRFRAAGNRLPMGVIRRALAPNLGGIDLTLSNVKGVPLRTWVAGVESIESIPFGVGGPAITATLLSGATHSNLGR